MSWCWQGCTFGDYSSYMELAFAINVLIAGWWDNIYNNLSSRMKSDGESQDLAMLGVEVDTSKRDEVKQDRDDLRKSMKTNVFWLKGLCFALGILIAAALLMIAEDSEISFWWMPWILVLPILCSVYVVIVGIKKRQKVDKKVEKIVMSMAKQAGKAKDLRTKK